MLGERDIRLEGGVRGGVGGPSDSHRKCEVSRLVERTWPGEVTSKPLVLYLGSDLNPLLLDINQSPFPAPL